MNILLCRLEHNGTRQKKQVFQDKNASLLCCEKSYIYIWNTGTPEHTHIKSRARPIFPDFLRLLKKYDFLILLLLFPVFLCSGVPSYRNMLIINDIWFVFLEHNWCSKRCSSTKNREIREHSIEI